MQISTVTNLKAAGAAMFLATVALMWIGCPPTPPSNGDHIGATNEECQDCHYDGDGETPPANHWEGSASNYYHELCDSCHVTE